MSYQALLHTATETQVLHVGTYADCLEALAQVGQAKGAPNPATIELKWQPEAVKMEGANRLLKKGWWGESEL